jgi:hypothetical protein
MMIGYDICDRFTMEHFLLCQSMILTTSFFLLATVDTLADSYVLRTSEVSGFAAEKACKYSSIISSNYVFKGLAFETLGPWCKEAIDIINVIGNRLTA